jgi:hypothetical protein
VHPYHSTGHIGPRFGTSGLLMEWTGCDYVMFEAAIHLRPLPTSMLDLFKLFESLVCCLKGIWVHPSYTIPLFKLAQDLEILGHLWS